MARPVFLEDPVRLDLRALQSRVDRLDDWRGRQPGVSPRSEAIRRLVDQALTHNGNSEEE
jgi:hypothetical protein